MDFALILDELAKRVALDKKEEAFFTGLLQFRKLKKRQFLVHEGELSKSTAFILKGCLRSYSVDSNGYEHILQFAPPGWWIADLHSVISKQPGKLNIDALTDSEILILERNDQEKLFNRSPKFERFFRIITENAIAAANNRLLDYMGLNAQERYLMFCKRYPGLIKTLPQKLIASYIDVTPEFLSKLKGEVLRKR